MQPNSVLLLMAMAGTLNMCVLGDPTGAATVSLVMFLGSWFTWILSTPLTVQNCPGDMATHLNTATDPALMLTDVGS